MLSALVASPALDLGIGRSRTASSKPVPTAVGSTTSVPETLINPVTRSAISIEYVSLRNHKHCPTGMYVTLSAESMLVWDAVLFVHKGDYAGAVLKFILTIPDNYPDRPPTVRFLTDVFHPLIATQTGVFNLTARFRPWRPKEHHIHDVLHFIKSAFKEYVLEKVNEVDALNKEAYKYKENRTSYRALAQQSSRLSQSPSALYDAPSSRKAHSFRFTSTRSEQVNTVLEQLSIYTRSEPSGRRAA